ncbi:MAG: histidine phosphatase family protein [Acidimicrobiales bacterium]
MTSQIVLVRHGETEWSRDDKHTGRTDIPLTARGRREASLVAPTLDGWDFVGRFSSPLVRASETAKLARVGSAITIDDDLVEWDYGVYEGRRTVDILVDEPGWSKWTDPIPDGERVEDVGDRADRAIERLVTASGEGPLIVFAHGHLLAILIARWLGLPATEGRRFVLETATVTVLGVKRDDRVLRVLNHQCGSRSILP